VCETSDLSTQFFINQNHIDNKKTRAEASLDQLQQLNPYVKITELKTSDFNSINFKQFQSVVLTEVKNLNQCIQINELCRANEIKFIMSDVYGLFGWCFVDLGNNFEVLDTNGEEYREQFIGSFKIEENTVLIEVLDKKLHDLENNDTIDLNNRKYQVQVVSPYQFKINTDEEITTKDSYFKKCKISKQIHFKSLKEQLIQPDLIICELSEEKFNNPHIVHLALHGLMSYFEKNQTTYSEYYDLINQLKTDFELANKINLNQEMFDKIVEIVYLTRNSCFTPLCAFFGGLVGQEVLKSITGKFTPLVQFINLDYYELYESSNCDLVKNDWYDNLRQCFGGEKIVDLLKNNKLFMVGCGAIGCEMLKNYALLGLGTSNGYISITDHDIIEKSNLNRQFLFRQNDIQKSKSLAAKNSVLKMNSNLNIKTYEKKVCVQTESEFNDDFFQSHDICVNALDNVEARRYMDSRCVSNSKPLIESGTLGPKGHVQVIIPHITESYSSQKDPMEGSIPYCTLKSFPSNIDHCIQWARDKFESMFTLKPTMFEKFQKDNQDFDILIEKLKVDENLVIDGLNQYVKMVKNFCFNWNDCLLLARNKFEKYFPNKAKDLLHNYPLDHLMNDGSLFWKLPKRTPHIIQFDVNNKLHLDFIKFCARLYADLYKCTIVDLNDDDLKLFLQKNEEKCPKWQPKNKHIETDETKKKEENTITTKEINNSSSAQILLEFYSKLKQPQIIVLNFEKDYDPNGHIDFINVTSNLRAYMYSIDQADKLTVKKIAGKIIPAIATTTSCIAGLATCELVKIIQNNWSLNKFRNVFLNLGISMILLSEPGACLKSKIADNCYVSLWDKWSIHGNKTFTLKNFIDTVNSKYKLTVSGKMIEIIIK